MRVLFVVVALALAACGGKPPVPRRLVVESDVGSWKFRRFQGPLLDIEVWVGIAVASTMPAADRKKLEKLVIDVVRTPEVSKKLLQQGWDVAALPADAFARRIETETAMLAEIIKTQNIHVN